MLPLSKNKYFLNAFMIIALAGFITSVAGHIASLRGEKLFEEIQFLHVGIFLVFLPAFYSATGKMFIKIQGRKAWSLLFRGCPKWMMWVTYALFAYAIANFMFSYKNLIQLPKPSGNEPMSTEAIRLFSGHWMIFYWCSFAILYSQLHLKNGPSTICKFCGVEIPSDKILCLNCDNLKE